MLLGLAAAISHTAVVWVVALGGQYLGRNLNADATEPYFQIASAVIILGVAVWMIWRTWRDQQAEKAGHDHGHAHAHGHDETRRIDTGHGVMVLDIVEDGVPPHFRLRFEGGQRWQARDALIVTARTDGRRQAFTFTDRGDYIESVEEVPEPHEFTARVSLGHGNHTRDYDVRFAEHDHGHDHAQDEEQGLKIASDGAFMDGHERAHAGDIEKRFAGRSVTTGQIVMFGLTGGLIPCPAAITVLLLCLQLKQVTLGAMLVGCFSIGLAITMVSAGVIAALSVKHLQSRWSGFGAFARRAPYASSALMALIALYMGVSGWAALTGGHLPQL